MNKNIVEQAVEPITLTDIVLYYPEGKPFRTYKKVILDGEAVKRRDGKYLTKTYLTKTAGGWTPYYQARTNGKILPPLPLLYASIERTQETAHPGKAGLLTDLKEFWLATSTRPNYKKNIVTHGYGFEPWELKCKIPSGDHYLDEIKGDKTWRKALQALLMPKDLERAIEVLNSFSGVRPYIWTPNTEDRETRPERAVWLSADSVGLYLCCGSRPDIWGGPSRGAVLEK